MTDVNKLGCPLKAGSRVLRWWRWRSDQRKRARSFTLEQQKSFTEQIAQDYCADRYRKLSNIIHELRSFLFCIGHGPVLELGAGGGEVMAALQELSDAYSFGVEQSTSMIEQAPEEIRDRLIQADGTQLPFPDNTFRVVLLWGNTLGPIPGAENRIALLREARRVVRADGAILIAVRNRCAGIRTLLEPTEYTFHYSTGRGTQSTAVGYNRSYTFLQLGRELKAAGCSEWERRSLFAANQLVVLARK